MNSKPSRPFAGFPTRGRFTPIHNVFFASVMPDVTDILELKVILHLFWTLYQKKGYPRFATFSELGADGTLMQSFQGKDNPGENLKTALQGAARHGALLELRTDDEGREEHLYFLNTDADRKALERIRSGELRIPGLIPSPRPEAILPDKRNIYSLYESNIGMLTPLIAEELKEAERLYPEQWIEDAFREAAILNKRNWRYVSRILERWSTEGKDHGKPERHTEEKDPDRYVRGRYGHVVRRR